MKKTLFYAMSITLLLFTVGCAEQKILERISLAILIGYDLENDNEVTATTAIRTVNQDYESVVLTKSETAATSKGTRVKVNLNTSKQVMAGQLRVVLLSKDLAEAGLNDTLHTIMMNSEMSSSVYLAVVDGDAKSLITAPYENVSDVGQHVFNLLDHNIEQELTVSSTGHEVLRDHYSSFKNMVLPLIKLEGKDEIQISGIALFDNTKMVGQLNDGDNVFYVQMLRKKFEYGTLQLEIPGDAFDVKSNIQIAIDSIKSNRTIKVTNPDTPEFDIQLKVKCRLLELSEDLSIGDAMVLKKIEEEMSKKMKSELERILKFTQDLKADIFGFGEIYHGSVRDPELDGEKWAELFPKSKMNIDVDVQIIRNGVFE
ncbi:hypothetical protein CD30_13270 [Ureibacillus massiliensis 4400831 = CIP 108448 = CCUG 49529]|uniref:Uncharacterized protein n=1 Tax=Ureibacillus massiliensis 4400831 = CIP 108448 = CCUG 49529 TaxID=1211035 RepID=A0A0A3J4L5_9BACL|nr:Ger(x)C family spore germination protein [Ureibacillus massiliensis]KGR90118.1 hypothetical protein CD30_13270 [Ureibacillus massiliensis 4400831 = CIP 108448 = CCUG 49529]